MSRTMVQLLKCVAQFTGETGLWRFIGSWKCSRPYWMLTTDDLAAAACCNSTAFLDCASIMIKIVLEE